MDNCEQPQARREPRIFMWLSLVVAAALAAGCATPPPPRPPGIVDSAVGTGASALDAQLQAITDDPAPMQARRVIFIGAALHSLQDVFDHDIALMDSTLRDIYGSAYRSVRLSNLRIYQDQHRALPLATIEHLDQVFDALAEHRRPNDRYIVLFSTHGSPGFLAVEQPARYNPPIRFLRKDKIAEWAAQLEPQPAMLVLSACFAGAHIQQALPDHLIALAAAAPDRASFGCHMTEQNTWFVDALAKALRQRTPADTATFEDIWTQARQIVAQQEKSRDMKPSLPESRIGRKAQRYFNGPVAEF